MSKSAYSSGIHRYIFFDLLKRFEVGDKTCSYMLKLETDCEDGNLYPLLVNSDAGALTLNGICSKRPSGYILSLSPFVEIEKAVEKSMNIGIAIPMEGGKFQVVRFSLSGSNDAIAAAEAEVNMLHDSTFL